MTAPAQPGAAARQIQQAREAAALAEHHARIRWLSADAPTWACGTPVDPGMRRILLDQSLAAVRLASQ